MRKCRSKNCVAQVGPEAPYGMCGFHARKLDSLRPVIISPTDKIPSAVAKARVIASRSPLAQLLEACEDVDQLKAFIREHILGEK